MHELIHSFYEVLRQFSETATVLIFYKIFWILITSFFYWHDYNCNAWCAFYLNEQNILTANQKRSNNIKVVNIVKHPEKPLESHLILDRYKTIFISLWEVHVAQLFDYPSLPIFLEKIFHQNLLPAISTISWRMFGKYFGGESDIDAFSVRHSHSIKPHM